MAFTQNAFGIDIPEIKDIFVDEHLTETIHHTLVGVLTYLGVPQRDVPAAAENTLRCAQQYTSLALYERAVHDILKHHGLNDGSAVLDARADVIYSQVLPYIIGTRVLDLGCGDGKVGRHLASRGLDVILADVYRNDAIDHTQVPFVRFDQDDALPLEDNSFDTTFVLTVFHHADDPFLAIREARRVTRPGGSIVVIESVYGVLGEQLNEEQHLRAQAFLTLSTEQQRQFNIFFDHFYNRIIHYTTDLGMKVNVPYNFNTPQEWKSIFEANGLRQIECIELGMDQPPVPEYHTLHVLEVQEHG